eukprot:scaffold66758_cov108-Phaeocystis_antarctica.AAC.1
MHSHAPHAHVHRAFRGVATAGRGMCTPSILIAKLGCAARCAPAFTQHRLPPASSQTPTFSRTEQRRSTPHECTNLPEEPLLVIVQAWQLPHAIRTPLICVNGLPIS